MWRGLHRRLRAGIGSEQTGDCVTFNFQPLPRHDQASGLVFVKGHLRPQKHYADMPCPVLGSLVYSLAFVRLRVKPGSKRGLGSGSGRKLNWPRGAAKRAIGTMGATGWG